MKNTLPLIHNTNRCAANNNWFSSSISQTKAECCFFNDQFGRKNETFIKFNHGITCYGAFPSFSLSSTRKSRRWKHRVNWIRIGYKHQRRSNFKSAHSTWTTGDPKSKPREWYTKTEVLFLWQEKTEKFKKWIGRWYRYFVFNTNCLCFVFIGFVVGESRCPWHRINNSCCSIFLVSFETFCRISAHIARWL